MHLLVEHSKLSKMHGKTTIKTELVLCIYYINKIKSSKSLSDIEDFIDYREDMWDYKEKPEKKKRRIL